MLAFETLENIIEQIKKWEKTSKEVFEYFQKRIEKYDSKVNAFNYVNKNFTEKNNTILSWLPVWIKDLFCEKWIPTTWASNMLANFIPPYDATVIKKLNDAWMNSIWKLNLDEFAMWSSTETSAFKKTKNPWDTTRIPGWSSWWSAVSVAAWLCPASLWTDTGWSIRQPASMCWIVWFKPSYGRNSRFWVIAMASSLDCPWTFTRTVKDASILYEIMNWEDSLENTTIAWKDKINPEIWNTKDLKWVKLWIPKEYFEKWLDKNVRETIENAIKQYKDLWAEIVDISLPMTKYAVATYYILMPAEVSTNLARLDGIRYWHTSELPHENLEEFYINNRWEWFWAEAQRRIILWSYVLSAWFYDAYYKKATQIRTLIIKDFEESFKTVDAIICPTSPNVAWKLWEKTDDPLKMYLADAYTIPASLAWLPWITIPCWFAMSEDWEKKNLPVWLQILTPLMQEERLFEIANAYEQKTKWYEKMIPAWFED